MMKTHELAIIGYGGMGSYHCTLLEGVESIHVKGVFDIDPARQEEATRNGLYSYPTFDELLNDTEVDMVIIAVPNDSHKDIAIKALNSGKHVICEKPVTLNSKELEEILEVADKTGKIFTVHQNRRWDEDYLSMKKIYDEKILGDIYHIETRVMGCRGIPGDWRRQKEHGGGMLLDWGVHLLDRLLLMTNEKIIDGYCHFSYIHGSEVDDGFRINLNFESGKTALVEVQTNNYIILPHWYMAGTDGTAVIEDWKMTGHITKPDTGISKDAKPIVAGFGLTKTMAPIDAGALTFLPLPRIDVDGKDFYRNVVNTIDGKEELIVKHEQSLRLMRLLDALFASQNSNGYFSFNE